MADTTNPVTSTTSTNATTNNDLPVINLDALVNQETQTPEEIKQPVDTTVEAAQSAPEISQTTDTASVAESTITESQANTENVNTAKVEDPFEGLNIVLGEATSNEPGSEAVKTTQSFVDPFLNPKKTETSEATTATETNIVGENTITQNTTTVETNSSSEPINLDAMLASVDTSTSIVPPSGDGLSDKKRKMIMIGSGVLGLIVLAAASYFVFTTMYPSGMGLTADISGNNSGTIANGGNTGTDNLPDPLAGENVYRPDTTTTPETNTNPIKDDTAEEELTTTPAESFGKEDELPAGETATKPEENKPDTSITNTGANEEELPTDVKPEVSKAIEDLNRKIEGAKQLLTLLRTKPNPEQTKELAGIIKEIKSILSKLNSNGFTSFTEEIEKPMSDLGFRYDKLTTAIVGN